jgi:hypothetical protein
VEGGEGVKENHYFVRTKKRRQNSVWREAGELGEQLGGLPGETCEHRILSFSRISAAAFVQYIADQTVVRRMSICTFRVGPRALKMLSTLHGEGKLLDARFVLGRLAASRHLGNCEQKYWFRLVDMCEKWGWEACAINNHSKIALFDTDDGKFVLATSGNLNEAPNWEQYIFQQDEELYGFFDAVIDEMFDYAARREVDDPLSALVTEGHLPDRGRDAGGVRLDRGRELTWQAQDRQLTW